MCLPTALKDASDVIPHSAHGLPTVFETDGPVLEDFSERERRLLVGALNFHALMAPERTLAVHLYGSESETLPRLTDDSTFTGLSRSNRRRSHSFQVRSLVARELDLEANATAESLIARPARHLHISRDAVLEFDPVRPARTDIVGRIARKVKVAAPLWYDELRDFALLPHMRRAGKAVLRQNYEDYVAGEGNSVIPVGTHEPGAMPAVIIGMHWFELGGAELWAFETIRLVREAGFLPIVLTNRDSHQPWITRAELGGAMLIPFSEPTAKSQTLGEEQLLRALLRSFDVRGVVVHHNQWLYDRLAWVRRSRPQIPIVDSTHIVEYRGGGFPISAAVVTENVSLHHVISPTLADWFVNVQGVSKGKVVMAPLGGLTVKPKRAPFRTCTEGELFTVAFVGRMARQKGPEVFAAMVRRLAQEHRPMRFIMHGDGELASWVDEIISTMGLSPVIERRTSASPVAATLAEAHLLVVSSHNEGLTLTTLEAIAQGVPVVSTDVGAQSDVIPSDALVPRDVHRAARRLAALVAKLAEDEPAREHLWQRERKAEKKLLSNKSATEWFAEEVRTW